MIPIVAAFLYFSVVPVQEPVIMAITFLIVSVIGAIFVTFAIFAHIRLSSTVDDATLNESEVSAGVGRKWSRRKMIIVSSVVISLIVIVLFLFQMVMVIIISQPLYNLPPPIAANKGSNATVWTWTIVAIGGSGNILKDDVYVQVKNTSGVFAIQTELLSSASGTHGFYYDPIGTGDHMAVGDVFSLSRDYLQGCTVTLVKPGTSNPYCILTV